MGIVPTINALDGAAEEGASCPILHRKVGTIGPLAGRVSPSAIHEYAQRVLTLASYDRDSIEVSIRMVPTASIRPLSGLANPVRLSCAQLQMATFARSNQPLFGPAFYRSPTERWYRFSMPPVVERHDDSLVLIDGLHRSLAAHRAGAERIAAVVVSGGLPPVPARPQSWPAVRVLSSPTLGHLSDFVPKTVSRNMKFDAYADEHFRPLGSFLRGSCFWFGSLSEGLEHISRVVEANNDDLARHFKQRDITSSVSPQRFWRYA